MSDLVANCAPEFSANDLKRMELVVLSKIGFNLAPTTTVSVLQHMAVMACRHFGVEDGEIPNVVGAAASNYMNCLVSYEILRYKVWLLLSASYIRVTLDVGIGAYFGSAFRRN